jgi:hypothetical protein
MFSVLQLILEMITTTDTESQFISSYLGKDCSENQTPYIKSAEGR